MQGVERPSDDNREAWRAYWRALGMPWRTEPEVDAQRQQFLAARRVITPDAGRGIYPFRDSQGSIRLTRADVEWLVATHEVRAPGQDGGGRVLVYASVGPTGEWWMREGPDLRGADVRGVDLSGMRLEDARLDEALLAAVRLDSAMLEGAKLLRADCTGARLRGANLDSTDLREAHFHDADLRGASCIHAWLRGTDLQRAHLRATQFGMASLRDANLAGADLRGAHLGDTWLNGADLRGAQLDRAATTELLGASIIRLGPRNLPRVDWTRLPLATLDWDDVFRRAEGAIAHLQDLRAKRTAVVLPAGTDAEQRLVRTYRGLARSYQSLAAIWHEHQLAVYADRMRRRGDLMRDEVVRRHADPDEVEDLDQDESYEDEFF